MSRARIRTGWRRLAASLALGTVLLSSAAARAQPVPQLPSTLPEGEGRDQVQFHCAICHDLAIVRQQRLSLAAWNAVLDDMKKFGGVFTEEQRKSIVEYLSRHFRP